jgi:molybdate transport system substrate-binding protein
MASEAQRGEVDVFTSNSMRAVLDQLGPEFERASGYKLTLTYAPAKAMLRRLAAGESADLCILSAPAIQSVADEGKIDKTTLRSFGRCGIGVGVKAGTRKPDVSSVDAFKRAMLEAKSIVHSVEGASGIHFSNVIEQLGIADAVKAKATRHAGGLVGEVLAQGEVELGVQQIPELLAVPGIELVGPLPEEIQQYSKATAGIFTNAQNRAGAQALIDFLAQPSSAEVFRSKGFEPVPA